MKFTKIEGAGNDFIVIDDRAGTFSLIESQIRHLCHRNFGIGADGLILLQKDDVYPNHLKNREMERRRFAWRNASFSSPFDKAADTREGSENLRSAEQVSDSELARRAPQNFCSERVTIADRQGTSENENSEVKPGPPGAPEERLVLWGMASPGAPEERLVLRGKAQAKPDSSSGLGIWRMRIFNSDGRETEGCGNGLRCLGRFLLELGFPQEKTRVQVHDRIVELFYIGNNIGVDMGEPKDLDLNISTEKGMVHFVDTGVPHVVHFSNSLTHLSQLGPFWRHHARFAPRGANVNLAVLAQGRIRVRTFERGVEGETLACGTGACAVAAVAHALYSLPYPFLISFPGGELEIQNKQNRLAMIGPATKVFDGNIAFK